MIGCARVCKRQIDDIFQFEEKENEKGKQIKESEAENPK
jgi:hypothetical protein